jgi:hypothetical protein
MSLGSAEQNGLKRRPVAKRIEAARRGMNLSEQFVAEAIGMNLASYYDLESIDKWLPEPIAYHPYPLTRFSVTTQGRSRMR